MGKLMPGHRGGSAILSSFLLSAWSDLESGFQESWSDILSDTIWNLVDLAFLPTERTDAASLRRRQKRQEAQRFVEHELFEPGLGVTAIAQALHVSERYVQTLFAEIATTPSKYILERRLDLAAERLRRESQAAITEIALAVGFSDISYFCHCFRRRFGVSARSYRLSHRA
jgi:AraC-like DNA-binding protein